MVAVQITMVVEHQRLLAYESALLLLLEVLLVHVGAGIAQQLLVGARRQHTCQPGVQFVVLGLCWT